MVSAPHTFVLSTLVPNDNHPPKILKNSKYLNPYHFRSIMIAFDRKIPVKLNDLRYIYIYVVSKIVSIFQVFQFEFRMDFPFLQFSKFFNLNFDRVSFKYICSDFVQIFLSCINFLHFHLFSFLSSFMSLVFSDESTNI